MGNQWKGWLVASVVGVTIGTTLSLWLNKHTLPWIEFPQVEAVYVEGSQVVSVTGTYKARKVCSREEQHTAADAPPPLVWRQEVTGTGAEIVSYAPRPDPPVLALGEHKFSTKIPLQKGIKPDGWSVSITVSCNAEAYAIRSRPATVKFIEP